MSELWGTPEENKKFIEERIAQLRQALADEQEKTHERLQRIEENYKESRRRALEDCYDRSEPMRRELEALVKAASLDLIYSPMPPVIVRLEEPR